MDREALKTVLSGSSMFTGLDETAMAAVISRSFTRQVGADAVVFNQGDPPNSLYFVARGLVKVTHLSSGGSQTILRIMGSGEVMGCAAVFEQFPYPATATAIEDSEILYWGAGPFRQLMQDHPQLAHNGLSVVGNRVRDFVLRIGEGTSLSAVQRVAATLLRLAEESGAKPESGGAVAVATTRRDLADMAGTTYFTVSRAMSAWTREGVLESSRQRVLLKAPHRLQAIVAESS